MDREQAIRILSKDTSLDAVAELKYYAGFDREKVIDLIEEAMDMGAEALKKQIPKKLKNLEIACSIYGDCPNCGESLSFDKEDDGANYCVVCGQRLDWSE